MRLQLHYTTMHHDETHKATLQKQIVNIIQKCKHMQYGY